MFISFLPFYLFAEADLKHFTLLLDDKSIAHSKELSLIISSGKRHCILCTVAIIKIIALPHVLIFSRYFFFCINRREVFSVSISSFLI
jgi:hypothetical protein